MHSHYSSLHPFQNIIHNLPSLKSKQQRNPGYNPIIWGMHHSHNGRKRVGELIASKALKIYLLYRICASSFRTIIPMQKVTEQFPKDSQDLLSHKKHPYYISMLRGSSAYYSKREQGKQGEGEGG
jgi:hypothetical protein